MYQTCLALAVNPQNFKLPQDQRYVVRFIYF